jgi:hypothetical protein
MLHCCQWSNSSAGTVDDHNNRILNTRLAGILHTISIRVFENNALDLARWCGRREGHSTQLPYSSLQLVPGAGVGAVPSVGVAAVGLASVGGATVGNRVGEDVGNLVGAPVAESTWAT